MAWILSIVWVSKDVENISFRKLDLFPSPCEGREIPTLLGPLERANFNHCTQFPKCGFFELSRIPAEVENPEKQ
jgi:hypothetical protein